MRVWPESIKVDILYVLLPPRTKQLRDSVIGIIPAIDCVILIPGELINLL